LLLGKKIAIIGSGISGLTCAYLLDKHAEVTLFEANSYFGGHTNTVTVAHEGQEDLIDTGFIVFNKKNYPLFTQLIERIGVGCQDSEMSFSFSSEKAGFEYSGRKLSTLFSQKRNLVRPNFYRLLLDILRFNRDAKKYLKNHLTDTLSLKDFFEANNYGEWFWCFYLSPLVASIWSSAPNMVEIMPANFVLNFFDNHGLLQINGAPQWLTVKGGSHNYVKSLLSTFTGNAIANARVSKISRDSTGVTLHLGGESLHFDQVIFACHSDTAMSLLDKPSPEELNVLAAIPYQTNQVILHTDASVMPRRKALWSSWNYLASEVELPTLTYYMNRLQSLQSSRDYFVSVNLPAVVDSSQIIARFDYAHPVLHQQAQEAQKQFSTINGYQNTFFCGAYWFSGFHEDGVASAARVCKQLGVAF
jgi:predicted NAD/FAD-binding protein